MKREGRVIEIQNEKLMQGKEEETNLGKKG